jgi:hypothetical protein
VDAAPAGAVAAGAPAVTGGTAGATSAAGRQSLDELGHGLRLGGQVRRVRPTCGGCLGGAQML